MDPKKLQAALIAAGITAIAAALLVALFILLKGESPGIPHVQKCSSDGECPVLECADCMKCQIYQGRCVYSLRNEKNCVCVENETMPCEVEGEPGKKTCVRLDKLSTEWSKTCVKL
jgi:hypothetical protein